ncbi:MAG: signal peptidase II [Erysipelotrichales bacterium]
MKKMSSIIVLGLLILDQVSKYIVSTNMALYDKIEVIKNFFSIYYIRNKGAAFSMLEGRMIVFLIGTIIGIVLVYFFYKDAKTKTSYVATSMLLAGILGNFIDRLRFQEVIDFLSFKIFDYNFAIFNFADVFVCVGVALLIIDFILVERRKKHDR